MTSDYWTRLSQRVAAWREKHPTEYAQLETEIRADLLLPATGALHASRRLVVDGAVTERIRVLNDWPRMDEWKPIPVATVP